MLTGRLQPWQYIGMLGSVQIRAGAQSNGLVGGEDDRRRLPQLEALRTKKDKGRMESDSLMGIQGRAGTWGCAFFISGLSSL